MLKDAMREAGETSGRRRKKRRRENIGSGDVNSDDLENNKEAGKETQGAQGLTKNGMESVSPLSRVIRGFVRSTIDPLIP